MEENIADEEQRISVLVVGDCFFIERKRPLVHALFAVHIAKAAAGAGQKFFVAFFPGFCQPGEKLICFLVFSQDCLVACLDLQPAARAAPMN